MADRDPNKDPYAYLRLSRNSDGTVKRIPGKQETPASSDPAGNPFHVSKDVPINQSKGTFARIFVPREAFDSPATGKLPVIVYFHGGGFVMCNVSFSGFDLIYTTVVAGTPAVVVSIGYRLAPEHRLPAAYDDCEEGLNWLRTISGEDEWLKTYADFSSCFLMGSSAGGNAAYHVGLRVAEAAVREGALAPIRIRGLILHIPFFGGAQRSGSELRLEKDTVVPLVVGDLMWDLCLPVGADRDHEYCNPLAAIRAGKFDRVKELGWKVLVIGYSGDPFIDRQVEVASKLEEIGVAVVAKFEEGGCHGCDHGDPERAKVLSKYLKEFVHSAANISS